MATIINHNRPVTDRQLVYIRNFIEPWSEVPFTNILDLLVGLEVDEQDAIELDPDDYTVEDGSPQELPADGTNH